MSDAPIHVAPEEQLLLDYVREPKPALEEELVRRFMPLARSLALRYRGGSEPNDDLIQVASLALVKALRRYDPERGRRFAAFAAPTILGELRRHFRDRSWRLHMPRSLQERMLAVERAAGELTDEFGSSPSVAQISERLGASQEEVLDAMHARASQRAMSLDAPVSREDAEAMPMLETVGAVDPGYDDVESQLAVELCSDLTDRERAVLEMRFSEDLTQSEIGERLGVSQMQVSRIVRRALAKMLEAVQGDESPDGKRTYEDITPDARFPRGRARRRDEPEDASLASAG